MIVDDHELRFGPRERELTPSEIKERAVQIVREFGREMETEVVPKIVEAVKRRQQLAAESRLREIIHAIEIPSQFF